MVLPRVGSRDVPLPDLCPGRKRRGAPFRRGTNALSAGLYLRAKMKMEETNSGFATWCRNIFTCNIAGNSAKESLSKRTIMDSQINHDFDELDRRTWRSICDAPSANSYSGTCVRIVSPPTCSS